MPPTTLPPTTTTTLLGDPLNVIHHQVQHQIIYDHTGLSWEALAVILAVVGIMFVIGFYFGHKLRSQ